MAAPFARAPARAPRRAMSSPTDTRDRPNRPRLATFATSHFCEKARWALDWHGIEFDEVTWPPGLHRVLAARAGAKATSLPLLISAGEVVEGSSAIIDWAERNALASGRSLAPEAWSDEAAAIEQRADKVIGIHVRRLAYAALLPRHADVVRRAMFQSAAGWHRVAGNFSWPLVWRLIMKGYDIGPNAAADSRAKLEAELDWLDALLADGRPYLGGERFSRVDLTVASLLGPFARPLEMKVYHDMRAPEALAADVRRWSERPAMRFVRAQYREYRRPAAA
jgi:glutathione S-transferase